MGFADREWNRSVSRSRAASWSVNSWIIGICIAVFVLDGFLGKAAKSVIEVERITLDGASAPAEGARWKLVTEPLPLSRAAQEWGPVLIVAAQRAHLANSQLRVQALESQGAIVGFAFSIPTTPLKSLLHFSTSTALMGNSGGGSGFPQVWRFIGFQFLHADMTHLIFNMMGLWFFGPVAERYLGSKRYAAFYLLCGICGAAMYLVLNFLGTQIAMWKPTLHIPFLLVNDPTTPLVGASAGVFGVIMAAAFLSPRSMVLLFFVLPMQLRTLAYGLVGLALVSIFFGTANAGGEAAHLGGAIAGFWLIRNPDTLHALFDWMGRVDPTSQSRRVRSSRARRVVAAAEIDRILDKIRQKGLQSLSEDERQVLRKASQP